MDEINKKSSGFGIGEVGRGPESTPLDDAAALRLQPMPTSSDMVKCSCGHTVPRSCVMSASLGTSCSECYDDMSG